MTKITYLVLFFSLAIFGATHASLKKVNIKKNFLSTKKEHPLPPSQLSEEENCLRDQVTIIITTSPIPSNPKTEILEKCVRSIHLVPALRGCKKIIVFDGVSSKDKHLAKVYEQFKINVIRLLSRKKYFQNAQLLMNEEHKHLAFSLREAMKLVDTPYVFVRQHDFELIKPFDAVNLVKSMDCNQNLKHIKINRLNNTPNNWDGPVDDVIVGETFVPLIRCFGWSDNDHFTRKSYYMDFIFPLVVRKGPMEWFIHEKEVQDVAKNLNNHLQYGTYIYGQLNETPYLYHLDGRGTR